MRDYKLIQPNSTVVRILASQHSRTLIFVPTINPLCYKITSQYFKCRKLISIIICLINNQPFIIRSILLHNIHVVPNWKQRIVTFTKNFLIIILIALLPRLHLQPKSNLVFIIRLFCMTYKFNSQWCLIWIVLWM